MVQPTETLNPTFKAAARYCPRYVSYSKSKWTRRLVGSVTLQTHDAISSLPCLIQRAGSSGQFGPDPEGITLENSDGNVINVKRLKHSLFYLQLEARTSLLEHSASAPHEIDGLGHSTQPGDDAGDDVERVERPPDIDDNAFLLLHSTSCQATRRGSTPQLQFGVESAS